MFSEAFLICEGEAFILAKKLLENVFPIWGTPSGISNDWDTHITQVLVKALQTSSSQNF